MNPVFNYKAWKDRRRLSASRQFRRALWRSLEARWDTLQLPAYAWYQTHLFRSLATGISSLLVTVSFATGAFAYVSPTVTDGTALYPVKQTLEKVVEKTKRTPESRTMFYIKQVQRREQELQVLEQQKKTTQKVEANIHQLEGKLEDAQINLVARSGPDADQAFAAVSDHLDEHAASDTEFTNLQLEVPADGTENQGEDIGKDSEENIQQSQTQDDQKIEHLNNDSNSNEEGDE